MKIGTIISSVTICMVILFSACSGKATDPLAGIDLIPTGNAYYTLDGKVAFEGDFKAADFFSDGLAKVLVGKKWIFINKKGEEVFDAGECYNVTGFWNGIAWKMTKDGYIALDTEGKELFITFTAPITMFNADGKALVKGQTEDGKEAYGVIDRKGNITILNGDFDIYGEMNSRVIHSDRIIVNYRKGGRHAVIDMEGNVIVEPGIYTRIEPFDLNGNAIVFKDRSCGIIDKNGKVLFMDTEKKYQWISCDGDWYCYCGDSFFWGDERGNIKLGPLEQNLRFNGNKYAFREKRRYDRKGEYERTGGNDIVAPLFGGKVAIAYKRGYYYLYNEKGEKLNDDVLEINMYEGLNKIIKAPNQGHGDALVLGFPYVDTFWTLGQ